MADDFPDLHHKLCKKLAHLITGFYHLNMKSDEIDLIVRNTVENYEDEMDKIVDAANAIIEKTIKESAQGVDLLSIREAYRKYKDKIEQERASAMKEFNVFKENMTEKEKNVKNNAEKQVNIYQKEVERLKEKLWHIQKIVSKVVGYEVQFDDDELQAKEEEQLYVKMELEEKNRELDELKIRYLDIERAYKELEDLHAFSDKMTTNWSRDLMDNGEGLEWENELLRKKIIEQEKIILGLRKAIGQENSLYDGDDAASIEYGGSSRREVDLQKEVINSERINKEKEIERLQLKIEEYESRRKEANREHEKLIERMHADYSENLADMDREKKSLEAIIEGMNTTLDSRNEYITGLEERMKSLEEAQEKMNEEAQSSRSQEKESLLNQEIIRLNQLLADSKKQSEKDLNVEKQKAKDDLERLKEEFKIEKKKALQELREQLSKIKSPSELQKEGKIRELEAEVVRLQEIPNEKLEQRAGELAKDYWNKVNELSEKHNLIVRELREKHDEKVNQINKNYEIELEEIRKELRREKELGLKMKDEPKLNEIQNVKKEYEAMLQKISKSFDLQLEEKVNEYEATLKAKDMEVSEMRKEVEKAKEDLKDEMENTDKKLKSYKQLEKTIKEQKDTIESLQEELQDRHIEGGEEGTGASYQAELKKLKEGVYFNEDKDKIIRDHLKYAKSMEKRFHDLKKQCEERVQMLIEKYNELVDIFEMRPSRSEDLALIRQLQEEGLGREEEVRRLSEKLKPSPSTDFLMRRDESKVSFSQQATNAVNSIISSEKIKKTNSKNSGSGISPSNASTILPPISVSQFSIHMRSPPASNGLMTGKKFFK